MGASQGRMDIHSVEDHYFKIPVFLFDFCILLAQAIGKSTGESTVASSLILIMTHMLHLVLNKLITYRTTVQK